MTKKKQGGGSRRSKAESMTGAKGGAVEVRSGSLVPDLDDLSDKDINHHFNSIKRATESKDTAVSALRTAMKKADETKPGLGETIKQQILLERKNNAGELAADLALLGRVLKARGMTIQISIFDTLQGDEMDLIYRRFFKDGKDAKTFENPYPAGSDLATQAARGWRHGNAANLGMTPDQADKALDEDEREKLANLPPPPAMEAQPAVH